MKTVGTLLVSAAGQIEFCDPGAARLFGSSASELMSKFIATVVPDLPRRAEAPGSTPAAMRAMGRRVAWQRCEGRDGRGNCLALEVLSMSPSTARTDATWLILRRAGQGQEKTINRIGSMR